MNHYVLHKKVRQELDEIWEYIARDDADAADRWIYKLRDAFRLLAENPRAGHTRKT
jgi:plasmid stabilization system protein ParE